MDITTKFSDKVKHLEASAIREIFKLLAKPGIISFAGGAPDPNLFPKKEFAEIAKEMGMTVIGILDPLYQNEEAQMHRICDRCIHAFTTLLKLPAPL